VLGTGCVLDKIWTLEFAVCHSFLPLTNSNVNEDTSGDDSDDDDGDNNVTF